MPLKKVFAPIAVVGMALSLTLVTAVPVSAAAVVTPASGGGAISADDAGVAWTTLGSIVITEGASGDIAVGSFVLTIPAGFEFNYYFCP